MTFALADGLKAVHRLKPSLYKYTAKRLTEKATYVEVQYMTKDTRKMVLIMGPICAAQLYRLESLLLT